MADKKSEVWNAVYDELQSQDPLIRMEVAQSAFTAVEMQNPAFLDYAFVLCVERNVMPPPTLIKLLKNAAVLRLSGKTITKREAIAPIRKSAMFGACLWAFKLMHFGELTKESAINHACVALSQSHPDFQVKNSYLDKLYNQWSKDNLRFLNDLKKQPSWSKEEQKIYIDSFPEIIPKGLQGTRR